MADKRNSRKRSRTEEDHILRISILVVIILFVIAGIFVGYRLLNPRVDVTTGREKLEELTNVDVSSVESAILVVDRDQDESEEGGSEEDESEEGESEESESEESESGESEGEDSEESADEEKEQDRTSVTDRKRTADAQNSTDTEE